MRVENQDTPALRQLSQWIENMSVAMLTTINGDDQLISRPLAPLEMDREGSLALWFFTDLRYAKVEYLCPLNLSFSNMHNSTYVSVCGRGEICNRLSAHQCLVDCIRTPLGSGWTHIQ